MTAFEAALRFLYIVGIAFNLLAAYRAADANAWGIVLLHALVVVFVGLAFVLFEVRVNRPRRRSK